MIGNDIIDLRAAAVESRIHRKGFLEKLFLPGEIRMIREAAYPAITTWLLWSCKEAVYKIVHRNTRERKYAPQQFTCHITPEHIGKMTGTVLHDNHTYYYQSLVTNDYIHTCAATDAFLLRETLVFTDQQPAGNYTGFMQQVLSAKELFYKDETGIPYILHREDGRRLPVSVSHHGMYCGIAKLKEA
ncbi:4'-phosphopantetheinyl transferase superfamily protein [Chitinophaga sp.]|uniref:4'-phosphopantetheinyl transferase family protein n=1 Tax=Chitinophaga sp. TaxID=1869181 RepID=UPI002D0BDA3D|nr:4'-phosphopantetheinyl transferase superfamily protein [Chitinophaga sp.]HWV68728.1 4'-phosphopantetheinyl transferase superfamily protein [Chitinophaga sp.]